MRSSSSSLFGLFGGDFGLGEKKLITVEFNHMCTIKRRKKSTNLPFPDDSLDKTLDDELLLSLCASLNSLRYSSPDDMNGIGVTRSALWKDIGDAQLVMSTQDSVNKNKPIDITY